MKTIITSRKRIIGSIGVALTALLLGSGPAEKSVAETNEGSPRNGKIIIRGSNTIGEELAPALISEFKKDHPAAVFEVETKATGYGLAALRAGKCDIAGA